MSGAVKVVIIVLALAIIGYLAIIMLGGDDAPVSDTEEAPEISDPMAEETLESDSLPAGAVPPAGELSDTEIDPADVMDPEDPYQSLDDNASDLEQTPPEAIEDDETGPDGDFTVDPDAYDEPTEEDVLEPQQ
jgi:hypothetical protein